MKKIIAMFLIIIMTVPQTLAQINFGGEKIQLGLRGSPVSVNEAINPIQKQTEITSKIFVNIFANPKHTKKAIIASGVLAAVMYPSMTGYLHRSRDVSRQVKVRNLSLAIENYQIDNGKYPSQHNSGCFPYAFLLLYVNKNSDFSDPKENFAHDGCNDKNAKIPFAYRTFIDKNGDEQYILSVNMESKKSWNSAYSIDEIMKNPNLIEELSYGSGKYYIQTSL